LSDSRLLLRIEAPRLNKDPEHLIADLPQIIPMPSVFTLQDTVFQMSFSITSSRSLLSQKFAERVAIVLVVLLTVVIVTRIDAIIAIGVGRDTLSQFGRTDLYEGGAYSSPKNETILPASLYD
jgi:hypothetical protein